MSEIVKSDSNLIIKSTKIIKFDAKTKTTTQSEIVMLIDISGSMNQCVGKERKIDLLRKAIDKNSGIRLFAFSDDIYEIFSEIPEPKENTALDYAFGWLKSHNIVNKDSRLTLISDGVPDNPDFAMKMALQLEIPINTLYIGRKNDNGERFMQMLARMTGGQELTAETLQQETFVKQLSNGISKLLYGT